MAIKVISGKAPAPHAVPFQQAIAELAKAADDIADGLAAGQIVQACDVAGRFGRFFLGA